MSFTDNSKEYNILSKNLFKCAQHINTNDAIQLPQICVIGDQSSGKSKILTALTGVPFPELCVIGYQSSGKSKILTALTGVPFPTA